MSVKLAVIYYSTYGTNHAIAQIAANAAKAAGAEVRLLRVAETAGTAVVNAHEAWKNALEKQADIPEVSPADMEWADAYFFASPTRFGQAPSQLRAFIDTLGGVWSQGKLAGKAVTATTSAQSTHGGQEATILGLYTTFSHWGAIIVPQGYTNPAVSSTGGNPYGYSHTAGQPIDDNARAAISHQAKRLVSVARRLTASEVDEDERQVA